MTKLSIGKGMFDIPSFPILSYLLKLQRILSYIDKLCQNLYDFKAEIQFNNGISSIEEKLGFKAIFLEVKDTTQSPNFYFNVK